MTKLHIAALVGVAWMGATPLLAATQVYKCTIKGVTTYQSDPCPSGEVRKPPTVEQLNAERKKKLSQERKLPAAPPAELVEGQRQQAPSAETVRAEKDRGKPSPGVPAAPVVSFRCDGRKYCSQMTSCAEASYFLARCPGVKLDGNGDGVPCEQQWCRP